ncbi:MAG: glucokinase [Gammaproteobacteria bacterium]
MRLLVDLGGTNTRCAIQDPGDEPHLVRRFKNRRFENLTEVLQAYMDDLPRELRPAAAAMAVAAPVQGDEVELTNRGWRFSAQALQQALQLERLLIVNDFTAVAMALPGLPEDRRHQIGGGKPCPNQPLAVLGPGTGLGMSGLLPAADGWAAITGEGGHVTLAPSNDKEATIISLIRQQQGHVSAERLVSGFGLCNLYLALRSLSGQPADAVTPEQVTQLAEDGDEVAQSALAHFFSFLGITAGNLALTLGALGGVYIAGGITPKLQHAFEASDFRRKFEQKGRYSDYMSAIPTYLVTEDVPAFRGLAAILDGQMINLC